MNNCVFCKIVSGEFPSRKVYEDDKLIAILDINPSVEGHALVIPKAHAENMFETSGEDTCSIMAVIRELAPKIKDAVGAEGVNITTNQGAVAGQTVMHTHFHILPRKEGDGRCLWGRMEPTPDLDAIYEKIQKNLN